MNNYWKNELGTEFRNKTLEYIGGYAETYGTFTEDEANKSYTADMDISDILDTIVPLNLSCDQSKRMVVFVSKIHVDGKFVRGKYRDRKYKKQVAVKLYDSQDKEIDAMNVCIDSLIFLLDSIDSKVIKK